LAAAAVYLVPTGGERFELYTEPTDETSTSHRPERAGFWHRTILRLRERWRHAVHTARAERGVGAPSGRIAGARDWVVRRIEESIVEQRTLWSLRGMTAAAFFYPHDLTESSAADTRTELLAQARRRHGWWLVANLAGAAVTAVLVLLPGPNVIGYYFVFRVIAHYLSWSGARQALVRTEWRGQPEPALTELATLARVPSDARADRVAAIAEGLHLPRLVEFFDRVAAADG
jgi:hypothetical protein